jgi:hypothetical protein
MLRMAHMGGDRTIERRWITDPESRDIYASTVLMHTQL